MLYDLLEHLKSRVESQTSFKAAILPALPGFYTLNTAYIIVPSNMTAEFAITEEMFSEFTVDIYFVTSDCNADDVNTLSKNVLKGYESVKSLIDKVIPRGERSYSDKYVDANCKDIAVSMKTWMTGGKIPVSVHISTKWKAIIKG